MAVTRGAAKEAQTEQVVLERMTEIAASQPGVLEGYTLDPNGPRMAIACGKRFLRGCPGIYSLW